MLVIPGDIGFFVLRHSTGALPNHARSFGFSGEGFAGGEVCQAGGDTRVVRGLYSYGRMGVTESCSFWPGSIKQ